MSQLFLIRHGQAAAFSADSDRLTELGARQSRVLGEYLVARGARFDEVVTGTLRRQAETARLVGEAFTAAGQPWPQARVDAGWNEYDSGAVMEKLSPALAEQDAQFREKVEDTRAHAGTREQNRYFQRMFEDLMERWVSGSIGAEGVEPFADFHARVCAARARVLEAEQGGRRVAVFTSGGPIGACVQLAMDAPARMAMQVNWRVMNASITEFTFSKGRLSFDAFNRIPHLDEPALRSYR